MHRRRTSRRTFLGTSAAAVGACWILPSWAESPNEKLNVAVVGVANRGGANLAGVSSENIVALCDVDANYLAAAAKNHPQAKLYRDFRRMLDEVQNSIDAVVVSTPDHTHAPPAAAAMSLGKHCYCEKPLTHCVYETRVLTELAVKNRLATQLGTQIHAGDNYRRVVELVQAGVIGPISEVHVWSAASYSGGDRPTDTPPVPEYLDWDLWLGPAPYRPYHPAYVPFRWRGWKDFGNGGLGDFFCHYCDLAFWALDLRYPLTVEAEGPPPHPDSTPPWLIVRYEFPARGDLPPVKLTWYDGGKRPPLQAEAGLPDWASAVLFVGEKGMLLADYGRRVLWPEEKFADFTPPPQTIPASIGHHQEWIEACKGRGTTTCRFEYSGPLTEAALLGTVAYRTGRKIEWDAQNLKAIGCPEADPWIHTPYREGWKL
ncbi:Gfo/Idh/MocA family protein [Thermopirellula anaerolimosa]